MVNIPITALHRRVQYTSTGSAGPYSFSCETLDEVDLAVYSGSTLQTLTTNYTVTIAANGTGSVTFGSAVTSGVIVTILSNRAIARTADYTTGGDFTAASINTELDSLAISDQQLETWQRRSIVLDDWANRDVSSSGAGPLVFPYDDTPLNQAGAYIVFDALGTGLTTSTTSVGQWLGADGTVSLPYYSYSADPDTGFYRIGTGNIGYSANGSKVADFLTTGLSITGTLAASGAVTGAAGTFSGILKTDNTTDATSGTDGSLQTDGGLSVAKAAYIGTTAKIVGVTTHGGDVVSDADSTDSLGTSGVRWASAFIDDITLTDKVTAAGLITGGSAVLATGATITAFDASAALGTSDTVVPTQNAVKTYVDGIVSAMAGNWKAEVINATTANITLSGEQTIDGVLTSASRILVKDQSTGSQNGIYQTSSGAWSRTADADAWTELISAAVFVSRGTAAADTSYVCTNDAGGTLGSTAVVWTQFGVGGGGGGWLGASDAPNGDSTDVIRINVQSLNASNTILATDNGSATGPLSIASGVTLTISSGATFVVI